MSNKIIEVKNLSKTFSFSIKKQGSSFFRNLLSPETKIVNAVDDISFSVNEGERIAFIGPNGAGKSTTIKMLTGILFPTKGKVSVLGFDPTTDRKALAYKIGTVFGFLSPVCNPGDKTQKTCRHYRELTTPPTVRT